MAKTEAHPDTQLPVLDAPNNCVHVTVSLLSLGDAIESLLKLDEVEP